MGSFDETTVILETDQGILTLKGKGLHIGKLSLEQGEVELFAKIGQERYYTVEEKSVAVMKRLCRRGRTPFLAMFDGCRSRSEAVAVFLAVLELVRYGRVDVEKTEGDELLLTLNRERKERDALESD